MTEPDVEILERRIAYQGHHRIDLYRLRFRRHDGAMSRVVAREVFERGNAAAVLPYDPARDLVVLLEQFRVGALGGAGRPWCLEPVAGVIEPGETAEEVARRESREEAGLELKALLPICTYLSSPGGTSERIALYLGLIEAAGGRAARPRRGGRGHPDAGTAIRGGLSPDDGPASGRRQPPDRHAVAGAQPRARAARLGVLKCAGWQAPRAVL